MKKIFFACVFSLFLAGGVQAQTEAYTAAVEKLLTVTNAKGQFESIIPQLFTMLRGQLSGVPSEFWDKAEAKFIEQPFDETLKIYAPLYNEALTLDELNELIKFYESPLGQKMAKVTPEISAKAMAAGQEWGSRIMQEVVRDLQAEGYLPVKPENQEDRAGQTE